MAVELPEGNSSYRRAIFYCKIKKIRVTGGQGEGALQLPEGTAKGRFSCRRASEGIWPPLTQFLRLFVFFGFICFFWYQLTQIWYFLVSVNSDLVFFGFR